MKKLLYLALVLSFTVPCYAKPNSNIKSSSVKPNVEHNSAVVVNSAKPNVERNSAVLVNKEVDGTDSFADIPLRVGGFFAMVVGTGVFVAVSPIAGLMALYPPHDAADNIMDFLIFQPARYTFDRPVGNFNYDSRIDKKNQ